MRFMKHEALSKTIAGDLGSESIVCQTLESKAAVREKCFVLPSVTTIELFILFVSFLLIGWHH